MKTQLRVADRLPPVEPAGLADPVHGVARVPPPAHSRAAPGAWPSPAVALEVREIDEARHLAFLLHTAEAEDVSFLQTPAWGRVKTAWRPRSLGWFEDDRLVGTALVLHRDLPRPRVHGGRNLAYIPEGPTVDWHGSGRGPEDWLEPLVAHLRSTGAFGIKLGPRTITRSWDAAEVKAGMADPAVRGFAALPSRSLRPHAWRLTAQLRALGWRRHPAAGHGIVDIQPRHCLRVPLAGRTPEAVLAAMSTQWRRNIRAAERAGVRVWRATTADLPAFHAMYLETAHRDGFKPRPRAYFERMFRELLAADPDGIRLYFAGVRGVASAGAAMVRLRRHAWFGYGASTSGNRELRASNALQWGMIQDCIADGMDYYDLRGVGESLDPCHPMFGLLRFKLGTGSEVVEYPGEYDFDLHRPLALAARIYLRHR